MNRKSETEAFWDLVNHFEDYLDSGITKEHEPFVFAKIERDQAEALGQWEKEPLLETSVAEYRELSPREKHNEWTVCSDGMKNCMLCALSRFRTAVVPGLSAHRFDLLVVGDFPSDEEDRTGKTGSGAGFGYLTKWLASVGLTPGKETAVTSVLKCRPESEHAVSSQAAEACRPYLEHQIAVASPKAILATGDLFARYFLKTAAPVSAVRGQMYAYKEIPVIVTYSPQTVLDDPGLRRPVWEDLKMLRRVLENRQIRE